MPWRVGAPVGNGVCMLVVASGGMRFRGELQVIIVDLGKGGYTLLSEKDVAQLLKMQGYMVHS